MNSLKLEYVNMFLTKLSRKSPFASKHLKDFKDQKDAGRWFFDVRQQLSAARTNGGSRRNCYLKGVVQSVDRGGVHGADHLQNPVEVVELLENLQYLDNP